jgi:C-terminal processing protease CtpA/Prc
MNNIIYRNIYLLKNKMIVILFLVSMTLGLSAQSVDTIQELNTFQVQSILLYAKVYGGIRHFYPSRTGIKLAWDKFAVYGVQEILLCNTNEEVVNKLQSLFYPLCDKIQFSINQPLIVSASFVGNKAYRCYEHTGIGRSVIRIPFLYDPYHTKVRQLKSTDTVFYYTDSITSVQFGNIYFTMPTAYKKNKMSADNGYKDLLEKIKKIDTKQVDRKEHLFFCHAMEQAHRIANFIVPYNDVRFFFPYNHLLNINWDERLQNALITVCKTKDTIILFYEMHNMFNVLNDAHLIIPYDAVSVHGITASQYMIAPYSLPVEVYYKNDTAVIVSVDKQWQDYLNPGSIIDSIAGVSTKEFAENRKKFISGSAHYRENMLASELLVQYQDADFKLHLITKEGEAKQISLTGTKVSYYATDSNPVVYEVEKGIYCLNFSSNEASVKSIRQGLKFLRKQSNLTGIIIDMRKQWFNHRFLAYFCDTVLQSAEFHYPIKRTPDRIERYKSEHFKIHPKKRIFTQPIVFLSSSRIMSYGETIMDIVDYYKLGDIVGESTAGCNGDMAVLQDGIIGIHYITGCYVTKHDGQQLYGIGIKPTISIENQACDAVNGFDRQMRVAIEVIKRKK